MNGIGHRKSSSESDGDWITCIQQSSNEELFVESVRARRLYKKGEGVSFSEMQKAVRGKVYARSASTMCSALNGKRRMTPDCARSIIVSLGGAERDAEKCAQYLKTLQNGKFIPRP